MEIFNCLQGSPEWFAARLGLATASEFATVLAKGQSGGESKTRRTYMSKLAGEIITSRGMDQFFAASLERGHIAEPKARALYTFLTDDEPELVGFIKNHDVGASPDALIGANGMLEIKSKAQHLLIDLIRLNQFPPEFKAQCQGQLWIAEREWVDIACYCPAMPLFVRRAYRDEAYIAELAQAVTEFNEELAEVVEMVRAYGRRPLERLAA